MPSRIFHFLTVLALLLSVPHLTTAQPQTDQGALSPQPDQPARVLFIAIDDLANALGCYGDPVAITPHLDKLAKRGVRFDRAYCQLPLCNPSRASVLTGRHPDNIRVYDLDRHFRDEQPDAVSLPQLFRNNDIFAARVGKLYHYNVPAGIGTDGLDDAPSWDLVVNPKGRDTLEEHLITNAEPHRKISAALSWLAADGADEEQTDGMITTEAIKLMEKHRDESFFLGVGFFRPHTPYVAPRKYFDLYPIENLKLPEAPADDREDIPVAAFANNNPVPNYGLEESVLLQALQGYYATVSFVDAQIGRLMGALDRLDLAEDTLVVVWSDHGYHLGEHLGTWQKRTLFEESARAPLIVYQPGATGNGSPCEEVVEFVDIYPTVAKLCGLELPEGLTGRSFVPLLENPGQPWKGAAYTQVLRPADDRLPEPVMGRSIRTDRWRYTEWAEGDAGVELYDHENDPNEFTNLAADPQFQSVIEELRPRLQSKIDGTAPKTPFNQKRL
jgi:iduronate 2-sulfatase